jgi:hypothetical protein
MCLQAVSGILSKMSQEAQADFAAKHAALREIGAAVGEALPELDVDGEAEASAEPLHETIPETTNEETQAVPTDPQAEVCMAWH